MSSSNKRSRPYKKASALEKSIKDFLTDHSVTFKHQGSRIGNYFEMTCYNDVVRYYLENGFSASAKNLQSGVFRYKISANGNPENFSHFLVEKVVRDTTYQFEIHHNLSIECPYQEEIFYTADISVITKDSIERISTATYKTKRSRCRGCNVQTFFEVKHLSPFPELLFAFTGIPENLLLKDGRKRSVLHLAPSLLMSGRENFHGKKIKEYLENKYEINMIFDVFGKPSIIYSKRHSKKKIGTLPPEETF
jgi:hypothetical protein